MDNIASINCKLEVFNTLILSGYSNKFNDEYNINSILQTMNGVIEGDAKIDNIAINGENQEVVIVKNTDVNLADICNIVQELPPGAMIVSVMTKENILIIDIEPF